MNYTSATSFATGNNLGTMLIDATTGQMQAFDTVAANQFGIGADNVDSISLHSLFSNLKEKLEGVLSDQNDEQTSLTSTLVTTLVGSNLPVLLTFQPLIGSQQRLLLVTILPASPQSAEPDYCDALTGLPDRRALVERFRHRPDQREFAVLFVDLDQFKQVNDRYGHSAGDRVLVELASRWQSCLRESDMVVRYGGDEFVVFVADVVNRADVEPVVERLQRRAAEPISIDTELITVNASVGVALSTQTSGALQALIDAADRDMYRTKGKS